MWRQEGFRYHHAEPDYLMLVYWIPETANTLPANATHRVAVGAIVMNDKREVFAPYVTSSNYLHGLACFSEEFFCLMISFLDF